MRSVSSSGPGTAATPRAVCAASSSPECASRPPRPDVSGSISRNHASWRVDRAAGAVDRRILFFGDSFVAGTGDPTGLGWVGRVVAASFEAGVPLTAYALGVRGQASVAVAARWYAEAVPRLDPVCDCRVVFSFGTNDGGAASIALERSVRTLAIMLDEVADLDLPAFVVGPAPVGDESRDDAIATLSVAFAEVAAQRGVPFVSVIHELRASEAWASEAAAGDGAHPAAGGYEELARIVLAGGFVEWLRGRGWPSPPRR